MTQDEKKAAKSPLKAVQTNEKSLPEQIKYFNEMHRQLKLRGRFQGTLDALQEMKNEQPKNSEDFDDLPEVKIKLIKGYNSEVLSVSNSFIIERFVAFMASEIEAKIEQIDKVLLT